MSYDTEQEEQNLISYRAFNLMSEATGGDGWALEKLAGRYGEIPTCERLTDVLREAGIFFTKILQEDIQRIYSDLRPRYFLDPQDIAKIYRSNHNIDYSRDDNEDILSLNEVSARMDDEHKRCEEEKKLYGASLGQFRDGMACFNEQSYFYQTEEWKKRASVVRMLDKFKCTRCGVNTEKLHVHHLEYIHSAYSDLFWHNFESIRLKSLCEPCHEAIHERSVRGCPHFHGGTPQEKEEERQRLRAMHKAHDIAKECKFCFHR